MKTLIIVTAISLMSLLIGLVIIHLNTKTIVTNHKIITIPQAEPLTIDHLEITGSRNGRSPYNSLEFDDYKQENIYMDDITYVMSDKSTFGQSTNKSWADLIQDNDLRQTNDRYYPYNKHELLEYTVQTWYKQTLKKTETKRTTHFLKPSLIKNGKMSESDIISPKNNIVDTTPESFWETTHDTPSQLNGTIQIHYRWRAGKVSRNRTITYDIKSKTAIQ